MNCSNKRPKWKVLYCCHITHLRENDGAPQYTADSDIDGTYRLREWLQGKRKLEEVLNHIVVSKPETEEELFTTKPPDP